MRSRIIIAGIAVLSTGGLLPAQEDTMPVSETLRIRFLKSEFRIMTRQSELPRILVNSFSGFGPRDIADSDEPYNHSDFLDGKLPSRQIVVGGESKTVSFLVLNQGGIAAYRYTILIGKVSDVIRMCRYFFGAPEIIDKDVLREHFAVQDDLDVAQCQNAG